MDEDGNTFLHYIHNFCYTTNRYKICKYIIDNTNNININALNKKNESAFELAMKHREYKIANLFASNGCVINNYNIITAIICNRIDLVKSMIIDRKISIYTVDDGGMEIIHIAAYLGHLEILKFLVQQCHIDPDQYDHPSCDIDKMTPIDHASMENQLHVVQWLILKGKAKKYRLHYATSDSFRWLLTLPECYKHWDLKSYHSIRHNLITKFIQKHNIRICYIDLKQRFLSNIEYSIGNSACKLITTMIKHYEETTTKYVINLSHNARIGLEGINALARMIETTPIHIFGELIFDGISIKSINLLKNVSNKNPQWKITYAFPTLLTITSCWFRDQINVY